MKTAYPLGAILGLLLIGLVLITAPVRDEQDAAKQQAALIAQNKKLFMKYRTPEEMTAPVSLPSK